MRFWHGESRLNKSANSGLWCPELDFRLWSVRRLHSEMKASEERAAFYFLFDVMWTSFLS